MTLRGLTLLFLALYALIATGTGIANHRRRESARHFLHTSRDLSFWIVALSFLAANASALEVLTMIAVAAKYGLLAVHFYWIGAMPALAFLLCVLLPRFQQLGIRSVPEFLDRRYGPAARILSAGAFCLLMVAVGGITLCLAARLLFFSLHWPHELSIWLLTAATAAFLMAGGLSAVMYSEALQLLIFLLVLVPLTAHTLHSTGGIHPLLAMLPAAARYPVAGVPLFAPHARADGIGIVLGLGLILGFSYWCSDFLLVQRLTAARNDREMLRTPSIAIAVKLFLPLLLVLPGLAVATVYRGSSISTSSDLSTFDLALPRMLLATYPQGLAALALAAMLASLFYAGCSNIAAAVAVFTADVYRPSIRPGRSDAHYLQAGHVATGLFAIASAAAGFLSFRSNSLMEYIQLTLSSLNVPIAVILLAGIFLPRLSRRAGTAGLLAGTGAGLLNWYLGRTIQYGSSFSKSFYGAIFAALFALLGMAIAHLLTPRRDRAKIAVPARAALRPAPVSSRLLASACCAVMVLLYWYVR